MKGGHREEREAVAGKKKRGECQLTGKKKQNVYYLNVKCTAFVQHFPVISTTECFTTCVSFSHSHTHSHTDAALGGVKG